MRSDLELVSLLHYSLQSDKYMFCQGLCSFIKRVWINDGINSDEYDRLKELIKENQPEGKKPWLLWWRSGDKKPRIIFLRKLIKKYAKANMSNL